jgi:4-hydroxy-2-oxoheptanedioate aldolase
MQEALARTLIAVQIESAQAVENLDAMLAVEHLDMVFVGPNDLSHSLGNPPEDELRRIIDDVLSRAHAAGVRTGILAPTPELVERYRRAGVSLMITGADVAMLAAGARAVIEGTRAHQSIDR